MLDQYLKIAVEIAQEAGEHIRTAAHSSLQIEHKGAVNLVTQVDHEVERCAHSRLVAEFPQHLIVAEEASGDTCLHDIARPLSREFAWYLDPVDGTTNFAHSYPMYAFSLGLARGNELLIGVVYDPTRQEMFTAIKGEGAFLNGERIQVSHTATLATALIGTGFPYDRREHLDFYLGYLRDFIMKTHGIRRGGSAALDLCAVACGRLDGFWEWKLKPWDTVAGVVIACEAGATAAAFDGDAFDPYGQQTLVSNTLIHEEMLAVLAGRTRINARARVR